MLLLKDKHKLIAKRRELYYIIELVGTTVWSSSNRFINEAFIFHLEKYDEAGSLVLIQALQNPNMQYLGNTNLAWYLLYNKYNLIAKAEMLT